MKQKKIKNSFDLRLKAIKNQQEMKEIFEKIGITKEDMETHSPFVHTFFMNDVLEKYGMTEDELCEHLSVFAKVGFAKSGIFMYHPTNEKFVVMKINSECVLDDAKQQETLNKLNKLFRSNHGIR